MSDRDRIDEAFEAWSDGPMEPGDYNVRVAFRAGAEWAIDAAKAAMPLPCPRPNIVSQDLRNEDIKAMGWNRYHDLAEKALAALSQGETP